MGRPIGGVRGGRIFILELAIELCRVLPLVLVEKQPQEECLAFRSPATIKC